LALLDPLRGGISGQLFSGSTYSKPHSIGTQYLGEYDDGRKKGSLLMYDVANCLALILGK
jgi:hypothetical protein